MQLHPQIISLSLSIHFPFTFHIQTAPDTLRAASDSAVCCRWTLLSTCTSLFGLLFRFKLQYNLQSLWFLSPKSHGQLQSQCVAVSYILDDIKGESARLLRSNEYTTYPLEIDSIELIKGAEPSTRYGPLWESDNLSQSATAGTGHCLEESSSCEVTPR